MDCGGQCGPTGQVLEASHGGKAGGTSGHSAVLAIPDLRVGVRSEVRLALRLVVMQAGQGRLGFPPRGGSQSQSEGQPGAGEGQQQGRGGVFEQPGQQWGLGQGLLGPGVGDTLPWGVCSPTPSNRRQLRAGGRGAAVSGAGGVLTCWAPKHTSGSRGRKARSPVLSPWPSSSPTALWPALGTPAPPSLKGPHRAASMQGILPPQKTQAQLRERKQVSKRRGTPNLGPRLGKEALE